MINPIVIIVSAAVILSMLSVAIINKPKKPVVTGSVIVVLIGFVIFTFMIDRSISTLSSGEINPFVCFLTMNDRPTYDSLAEAFNTFMCFDVVLIAASLIILFIEIMLILRKGAVKNEHGK
ncbi:MAG: hypothetical protein IJU51_08740 [Clostridia bacterium]|nr:hypothetical protein [Clostridia bacterium]